MLFEIAHGSFISEKYTWMGLGVGADDWANRTLGLLPWARAEEQPQIFRLDALAQDDGSYRGWASCFPSIAQ
jgi:hypothetical protein